MPKRITSLTVREARQKLGLSQQALAERAGLEQAYVSKIELGKVGEPLFTKGLRIADALEIDPHSLKFASAVSA